MAPAEDYPLFISSDVRRAFGNEQFCRRIARNASWGEGSRVLDLSPGESSVLLAREFGCSVTAADADASALDEVRTRVKAHGVGDRVEVKAISWDKLPFGQGEFDGIIELGRVPLPLEHAVTKLRPLLAVRGRLVLSYPVKVGLHPTKAAIDFWEKRMGEPMRYPREVLLVLERAGFEPEMIETMDSAELDDLYRDLERSIERLPEQWKSRAALMKQEISLHRSQGLNAAVSLALVIGRRKEPGEKPPPSRDTG
jgi:ubiquinone/menaquinone biosynthesis C-methylase UbiE